MIRVLIAGLRATLPRLVATGLAIALSVGFVVATLTLSATFTRTTGQALTATMANADVHVTPAVAMVATSDPRTSTDLLVDLLPTIQAVDHVAAADVERLAYVELRSGDSRTVGQVTGMLAEPVRWQKLAGGAWPQLGTEATLDQASATSLGVAVGDPVSLKAVGAAVSPSDVTIVGITSTAANGAGTGAPALLMTPDALTDPAMFAVSTGVLVKGDGTPGSALAAAVTDATSGSSGLVVQTKAEAVDYQTAQLSGSASVITSILLAFAIVALFVASMVIANTFQVLVAQRTKDLALLRCIGASTGQGRRLILGGAPLTGAVASVLGAAAGLAGGQT
ncbi:MAG: ABC transporter permease, partial [Cellulomonas sp.]|nr:ABC transporter permease [Cellulomonas sp.]